jgi:hypothetical protein
MKKLVSIHLFFVATIFFSSCRNKTVQGNYELLDNDRIMVCTSKSINSINRYIINSLTENELILSANAENAGLALHFKPGQESKN